VQADVPIIIRTFVNTILNLEAFKQHLPVHWTDVDFKDEQGEGGLRKWIW
jgi:hypothetical protein